MDKRALRIQELNHKLSIHEELFAFLVRLEELRDQGRADYAFRLDRYYRPCLKVSIFLTNKKDSLKTWEVPLPLTEAEVGKTIAVLDKVANTLLREEEKRIELKKQELLSKLTPEEIEILTDSKKGFRYEG